MEQYFTKNPETKKEIYKFDWNIGKDRYFFYSSNSVFSKNGLDFGSMLLIETVINENKNFNGKILDMGCGYGPIGIIIAKAIANSNVTMADINERALELANMNAKENNVETKVKIISSSSFENINEKYDIIVTNPPIRAGKEVVFSFYEGAYNRLNEGGKLYVVIQKKQGAPSSKDKIKSLFGNCEVADKKSGYFILCGVR
ncbi:16S rRNA (guanine1207-N2)-methyltransferase [Sedimentibacter acidaminivorans]|uniref:16S rRNA (Guanine1207-N2)-methyltransferase n=1 Tax=Sedimentibacter acidaminivorans TaxID=913099 RepID=A0ABS4GDB3_9FIRM|nr:methyltransferase [Sedimentibacter acidaminivorans]MBP1925679.1 16S rRNA (guanine1207-N2)-methyltransferase [Sedimentibacter acidaminivorans]